MKAFRIFLIIIIVSLCVVPVHAQEFVTATPTMEPSEAPVIVVQTPPEAFRSLSPESILLGTLGFAMIVGVFFLLRTSIIKTAESISPKAFDMIVTLSRAGDAAIEDAVTNTPGEFDDAIWDQLKKERDQLIEDIRQAREDLARVRSEQNSISMANKAINPPNSP